MPSAMRRHASTWAVGMQPRNVVCSECRGSTWA